MGLDRAAEHLDKKWTQQTGGGSCPKEPTSESSDDRERTAPSDAPLVPTSRPKVVASQLCGAHPGCALGGRLRPLFPPCQCPPFCTSPGVSAIISPGRGSFLFLIRGYVLISPNTLFCYPILLPLCDSLRNRGHILPTQPPDSSSRDLPQGRQAVSVHVSQLRTALFFTHYTNKIGSCWKQNKNKKEVMYKTIVDKKAGIF